MKTEILFRADANTIIGHGHLVRCLALAELLVNEFQISFFCHEITESILNYLQKVKIKCNLISGEDEFLGYIKQNNVVVLDGYNFNSDYQKRIKDTGAKLICIDDIHDKIFYADLIINHAPNISANEYKAQYYTKYALGLEYALLRNEFFIKPKKKESSNTKNTLFLCFGGSDYENYTETILNNIAPNPCLEKIIVVYGDKIKYEHLKNQFVNKKQLELFYDVSATKMCNLMDKSDIAIVPSSSIAIEAFSRNLFIITGFTVDNQKSIYNGLTQYSGVFGIGNFAKVNMNSVNQQINCFFQNNVKVDNKIQENHKLFQLIIDNFYTQ